MKPPLPRLHAVTDPSVLSCSHFAERAGAVARTPGVALHLRSHTAGGRRLLECALALRDLSGTAGALLFVNDRVDVARVAQAAGLHLPAQGMPTPAARALVGPDAWVGRSTHSADEAREAADAGADYVFLGPIWETRTHPGTRALGPAAITALRGIRVVAIGGITPERARACYDAGAYGVAAISAIWNAPRPAAAVRDFLLSLPHDDHDDRSRQR